MDTGPSVWNMTDADSPTNGIQSLTEPDGCQAKAQGLVTSWTPLPVPTAQAKPGSEHHPAPGSGLQPCISSWLCRPRVPPHTRLGHPL